MSKWIWPWVLRQCWTLTLRKVLKGWRCPKEFLQTQLWWNLTAFWPNLPLFLCQGNPVLDKPFEQSFYLFFLASLTSCQVAITQFAPAAALSFQWYTPEACLQFKEHFHAQVRTACQQSTATAGWVCKNPGMQGRTYFKLFIASFLHWLFPPHSPCSSSQSVSRQLSPSRGNSLTCSTGHESSASSSAGIGNIEKMVL